MNKANIQCWIWFGSPLVSDLAGNAIIPIADADISSANSVLETPSVHVRETISPQLIDFDLDFTFGNISLSLNYGC